MSASVTVTRNFDSLVDLELVTRDDMRELGLLARERIVTRTREGLDANSAPFAPYSEGYAKQKQAALGHANVDLQVSGNMLNHLTIVDVDDDSVTLGWAQ
jgi:hypothetical protein